MKRYWVSALLTLSIALILCLDGDAGWLGRWDRPCFPFRCRGVRYAPPCVPPPGWVVVRPYDRRFETDKRDLPEFTEDVPLDVPLGIVAPLNFAARAFKEPDADTFTVRRHHRGRAKTTFANAPLQIYPDLRSLILSLPDDEDMIPLTRKEWDFDRIGLERRNVRVIAYLFAVKKESDNDYHLIVDDDGDLEEGAKFNVEVSGIPTEGPDIAAIRRARDEFKALFDGSPPRNYKPFLDPPWRVEIEGSLFFDRDHRPGTVGPEGYRPATAWEIHPVRRIRFLGN
jgi:hypothetical protein